MFIQDTVLRLLPVAIRAAIGRRAYYYLFHRIMSDAVDFAGGSGRADRPMKKQRRDGTGPAAIASGHLGGPMEEEVTARKKLQDAGFDPDSPWLLRAVIPSGGWYVNAMAYFCKVGDLKMCRYLLFKGASATQTWNDDDNTDINDGSNGININTICSPMYAAAHGGNVDICKWLCEHGGRGDIRNVNRYWTSPMHATVTYTATWLASSIRIRRQQETYRWLILNEALCPNDDGIVEIGLIREALRSDGGRNERMHIREWAEGAVRTYDGFMVLLMGTHRRVVPPFRKDDLEKLLKEKLLSPDSVSAMMKHLPEDQQLLIWNNEQKNKHRICVLQYLSGHPGIRQSIADMVGVVRGRELRIMRQLGTKMWDYIEEVHSG